MEEDEVHSLREALSFLEPPSSYQDEEPGFEICPYNEAHRVAIDVMERHLLNCRTKWKDIKTEKNEMITTLTCKYNYSHELQPPELIYHEERCPDRHKVWDYQLIAAAKVAGLPDEENLSIFPMNQDELEEMNDGWYIDTFIGAATLGKAVPLEKGWRKVYFRYADEVRVYRPGTASNIFEEDASCVSENEANIETNFNEPTDVSGKSGASASSSTSAIKADGEENVDVLESSTKPEDEKVNVSRALESNAKPEEDDDDDWEKDANRPHFNYMENMYNPTRPMFHYPPGLTKAQRKEFCVWNSNWFKATEKLKAEARKEQGLEEEPVSPYLQDILDSPSVSFSEPVIIDVSDFKEDFFPGACPEKNVYLDDAQHSRNKIGRGRKKRDD